MMQKLLIVSCLFICSALVYAQELTIEQMIEQAKQSDPNYQVIVSEEKKLAYALDQALPSRRAVFNLSGEQGFNSESDQSTFILGGELSKTFIETGTDISLSHNRVRRPDREENVTQLRLDQSLFKDAFGQDIRLKKSSLGDEIQAQLLQFQEDYEHYIATLLLEFLNYEIAKENLDLANKIYSSACELENIVAEKYRLSIANLTDLNRAKLSGLISEENLILKQQVYENLKQTLQEKLHLENIQIQKGEKEKLLQFLNQKTQHVAQEQEKEYRTIQISHLKQKAARKNARIFKHSLRPDLNFVLGYNIDDSSRFNTSIERKETVVGFILSVPFGNSQARATAAMANIDFLKSVEEKRVAQLDFEQRKKEVALNLEYAKKQKELNETKIKLLESIINDEEKRYRIGQRRLEDLLDFKDDHAQYQNQYQQAILNYSQEMIVWLSLHDQLLDFEQNI